MAYGWLNNLITVITGYLTFDGCWPRFTFYPLDLHWTFCGLHTLRSGLRRLIAGYPFCILLLPPTRFPRVCAVYFAPVTYARYVCLPVTLRWILPVALTFVPDLLRCTVTYVVTLLRCGYRKRLRSFMHLFRCRYAVTDGCRLVDLFCPHAVPIYLVVPTHY